MQEPAVADRARWSELLMPRHAAATATLSLGVALFAFNAFLVTTALPTAVEELDGVTLISWAVSIYLVFAILGGASAAMVKSALGSRRALVAAAALFLAGSAVCGLATGMPLLLAGRAAAGFGEGIIAALCYALIPELFPSRLVPKVFGAEAIVWAVAAFGGPVIAGVLTETVSWRAAFLVNIPIALVFAGLVIRVVAAGPHSTEPVAAPLGRLAGIGLAVASIAAAQVASGPLAAAALALAALPVLAVVVAADRRAAHPVLPAGAFRASGPVALGLWVVLLMPFAQAATGVFLVMSLQRTFGLGPTVAGAIAAVLAVAWSLSAIVAASIVGRDRHVAAIRFGNLLLLCGFLGLAAGLSSGSLAVMVASNAVIGAGMGASWGFVSQLVMETAAPADRDRASALLPTLQSAGYAFGAAVAGLSASLAGLGDGADAETLRRSIVAAFLTAAVVAAVSLAAAVMLPTAPKRHSVSPET